VLAGLLGGAVVLAGFVVWQRFAAYPMVDVSLFRERRFLWGSMLATLASFALFGLLFVLPQYLQAVRGNDAFGTGLRLLPVMAGLLVGTRVAGPLVSRVGDKVPAAAGMGLLALGLAAGATTTLGTGFGAVAAWLGLVGFGLGVALPAAMPAVLGSLRVDKAGVRSAMTMTFRQVGGALGVAVLGSVLASAYRDRLPADAPAAARDSVSAAVAVARRLGDAALLHAVDASYLHAMAVVLLVCAGVCALGALLAAVLLPAHPTGAPAASSSGAAAPGGQAPGDRAGDPPAAAASPRAPGEEESTHESARSA